MKKLLITISILIAIAAVVIIIAVTTGKKPVSPTKVPVATEVSRDGTTCYAYDQAATDDAPYEVHEKLTLTIKGADVTGSKQGTQSGPNMMNGFGGDLAGTLDKDSIKLTFAYTIEGSQNKEVELYKFYPDGLMKLRYPLREEPGRLVPDETQPYTAVLYRTAACE